MVPAWSATPAGRQRCRCRPSARRRGRSTEGGRAPPARGAPRCPRRASGAVRVTRAHLPVRRGDRIGSGPSKSASISGASGTTLSSGSAKPRPTVTPRWCAIAMVAPRSRVLPMPGTPSTISTDPTPSNRRFSCSPIAATSRSRPRIGISPPDPRRVLGPSCSSDRCGASLTARAAYDSSGTAPRGVTVRSPQWCRRDPRVAADLWSEHADAVEVAPRPLLVGLQRADDRMAAHVGMASRVPAGRPVAAPDVAALEADPQVPPRRVEIKTLGAAVHRLRQPRELDVIAVLAQLHVDAASHAGFRNTSRERVRMSAGCRRRDPGPPPRRTSTERQG